MCVYECLRLCLVQEIRVTELLGGVEVEPTPSAEAARVMNC